MFWDGISTDGCRIHRKTFEHVTLCSGHCKADLNGEALEVVLPRMEPQRTYRSPLELITLTNPDPL